MFEDGVDGVDGVNGEAERGKSSSFYVPEKPANPGQSDPNMVCKNWLESPFDDVIFEETYVQKSFSCWNGNFGSTSQTSVTDDTLSMFSCRDLLALAEASGGFSGETQHSGRVNLCDLNWPPQFVAEPPGLSLQFTPLTPDQMRRGSDIVVPNEDKRMNLAADKDVGGIQESEKGLTEEMNLNTPQKEQKRRKHRPKVVTEGKPRRARKPATPKPPDGSGTGKRKYVRRKGVEKSTETPETPGGDESREIGGVIHPTPKQPDGSSTGKRKYVRKNKVEKSTETPAVDESNETSGVIHPSPGRQSKKTCKRKINFDESEKQNEVTVDKACTMTSEVVEKYQKVHEAESLSPITPSKTELPQARLERSSTKAKCKINFLQETHDKGQIHVADLNETGSSMSVCYKGDEAHSSNWELSSEIDGIQHMHERHLEICHENLETYLSIFTDYDSGWKQCTQSYAVNERKGKAHEMSNDRYMQTYGQNTKRKKTTVRNYVPFNGRVEGGYQPQHTYMESHAADFQLSIPNKKRTKKSSAVPSLYHDSRGYNSNFGYETLYSAIDQLIVRLELLHIDRDTVVQGYHEKNALVVYQQDRSLVPYVKKRKQRPKVDLDEETNRVWMLLLEDINSQGIDGTDEDKAKWWEEERRVFRGRADSFIARMHLVQGDRRFSQWKGSVLDSVVGVFLTQNVSDHLSSSAFMSLAAQYPLKPNTSSEPTEMNTGSEPFHEEELGDHDGIPMMLQEADSCEEKEIINSNEFSKNCVISDNSECEVADLSEKDSAMCKESVINHIEVDEVVSSHNSADTCSMCKPEEQKDKGKATVKSASQNTGQMVNTVSSQESANSNCMVQQGLETTNLSTETSNASEINNIVETSQDLVQKVVDFHLNENGGNQIINHMDEGCSKVEIKKTEKKETKVDWDNLRLQAESEQKRERTPGTMDSMDYEAIRAADVKDVADAIKERGMNNRLAERIKDMLDRVVEDHGSIDLEWLRDVPPDKAKEYLLSFRGLGLKSVECIRLLTLQHLAFPVSVIIER
ncbi:hypothetical protein SSX86_028150 [Deinandra increscens subsp. villosa]|uniref:Uncharacterized protein n=1 Tax=Deinandra increscens subsp. villosa TaxID=3103831 RepID=A0AAP0GJ18_9ASTR